MSIDKNKLIQVIKNEFYTRSKFLCEPARKLIKKIFLEKGINFPESDFSYDSDEKQREYDISILANNLYKNSIKEIMNIYPGSGRLTYKVDCHILSGEGLLYSFFSENELKHIVKCMKLMDFNPFDWDEDEEVKDIVDMFMIE